MAGKNFDERDVDLLEEAVSLVPNLAAAAYAGKLARERTKYPIESFDGIVPLFDGQETAEFEGRSVTVKTARRYMPDRFFPIETERDLLCKLMIALATREAEHGARSARAAKDLEPSEELTIIPSPTPLQSGPGGEEEV